MTRFAPVSTGDAPHVAVFAPSPLLTVTVEHAADCPEVHFHAGGQGVWVARMAAELGAHVKLATALGGESGRLLAVLLETERVTVHVVPISADNGVYVHDRRGGVREAVVEVPAPHLRRHELDELYGIALADALDCGVACLTGPHHAGVLDSAVYARLTGDLRRNGVTVVADLTGPPLAAALTGGIDVLKLGDDELVAGGWATDSGLGALADALLRLRRAGARLVIASRGERPAIVLVDDRFIEIRGPGVTAADPSGTGDAMVAALAVSLAGGATALDALAFGAAAGTINATRHGLGTGSRQQVERFTRHISLSQLKTPLDREATAGTRAEDAAGRSRQ